MRTDELKVIIPLDHLKRAEEIFPEISMMIGPYLNCLQDKDYNEFNEELIRIVEESRSPDEVIIDEYDKEILKNFDVISDDVVTSLEWIKHQAEFFSPLPAIPKDFIIDSSKKMDDYSVELTIRHKGG